MTKKAETVEHAAWHAFRLEAAFSRVAGRREGLSGTEVNERLTRFGPNRLRSLRRPA